MDSALGEANITSADPQHIHQPGMPNISVLYYCDVVLHFWKAETCRGIHLFLQEHCQPLWIDDSLRILS